MERLRRLCRAATIAIPPNAYRAAKAGGGEAALAAALEALLAKHGLDKGSDRAATDAVRARLQLQRDLDGVRPIVSCIRSTIAVICYALLDPGWPTAGSRRVVQTPSTHVRNIRGTARCLAALGVESLKGPILVLQAWMWATSWREGGAAGRCALRSTMRQ